MVSNATLSTRLQVVVSAAVAQDPELDVDVGGVVGVRHVVVVVMTVL